ncbi:MAG TPA: sigma factor [Kofleriaceae bacterium]|nr:sigma factor [Kofleriaceae bacterium]
MGHQVAAAASAHTAHTDLDRRSVTQPASADVLSELVGRVATGDRAAFARLFTELWPVVRRFCVNMMRADIDADDAAQEAMMKIFSRAAQYDATRPVLPWALTISAWECRTLMQKRRRRREAPNSAVPDPSGNVTDDDLAQREITAGIEAALNHLSAADRAAMLTAFWQIDDNAGLATATAAEATSSAAWQEQVGNKDATETSPSMQIFELPQPS